jgi:Cu/Ag efflux protein CusF
MKLRSLALASILAFAAGPVSAQDQSMPGMDMSGKDTAGMNMHCMQMDCMNMQNIRGMHTMSATVTAINASTGLTGLDAGGMKLRVHFPAASLSGVKAGDKITLHLGFTMP